MMSIKLDYRNSLRGVRKCPRCSTVNGNRASSCKNQSCQHKLRDGIKAAAAGGKASTPVASAVQLVQAYGKLYSVCLQAGGDRHFVESSIKSDGTLSLACASGIRMGDIETIHHLIAACKTVASAVPLQRTVVDSLAIAEEEKRSIWEIYSLCNNTLVQRVATDVFAVGRLRATYGLFHVVALRSNQKYSHFYCDCLPGYQRTSKKATDKCWHMQAVVAGLLSAAEKGDEKWQPLLQQFTGKSLPQRPSQEVDHRCSNENGQYVEMLDFILNPTTMELFNDDDAVQPALVSLDAMIDMPLDGPIVELAVDEVKAKSDLPPPDNDTLHDVMLYDTGGLHLMDCQIELMDEFDLTDRIDFCPSDIECDDSMLVSASVIHNLATDSEPKRGEDKKEKQIEVTAKRSALRQCGRVEKEKLTRGSYSVRKLMKALESNGVVFNRIQRAGGSAVHDDSGTAGKPAPAFEATLCNLSFTHWLEAVIEQLDAVIDYNADGRPPPQTFRIHEDFFRCLRARFSVGHRSRQPDEDVDLSEPAQSTMQDGQRTMVFRFSHHKSLLQVFRTDRLQLSFVKNFIRTSNDRYVPHDLQDDEPSPDFRPIQPHRYSTYIKMGRYKHEPDPKRVYHFSLEWTAGVLPRSRFGDLRISFEYGHRFNNQYVPPPSVLGLQ